MSVQVPAFSCFGYIPRRGTAESYGNSMFNFWSTHHNVFHGGCTILHSQQQCTSVPISCQHLLYSFFFFKEPPGHHVLLSFFQKIFIYLFIYLFGCTRSQLRWGGALDAVRGLLSCGRWALQLWHVNSQSWHACGIFPDQGSNPGPLHWEHRVLSTVLPGKSHTCYIVSLFL